MSTISLLESIFEAARQLADPAERNAYLNCACANDGEVRARIELLLSAHGEGDFLESPAGNLPTRDLRPFNCEKPGSTIGPYKLLEQIGEGGMGLVFMAEQTKPIRRRVALKIIKPGLDTRAVIARFEAERQALALMDHPNIARVYDAGATDTGRPYFVMELVRGTPITDYCSARGLDLRERLELFDAVCQAVQHAHQKGVIHRDLKPTNILVSQSDTTPVPKVIDFGVAKATASQSLTDKTLFTAFTQIIGTPLYMSPEQADLGNQDVDTRSDVYSLGVVLYEILTGTTPFDAERLRSLGHDEMRRIIREEEPPKPSTRATTVGTAAALSTVASNPMPTRPVDVSALKGDLDWIVMKALDKDRRRRYESPSTLAADLQRHLERQPVHARPPSYRDKLAKWSQRHVAAVWSATAILLISTLVLGGSSWRIAKSYREAQGSAEKARQAAAENRAVVDFLVNDLLAAPVDEKRLEREITVSEVLVNAESKVETALADQPLVEAAVRHGLARSFHRLRRYEKAEPHARQALEIRTRLLGPTHHDTLESTTALVETLEALQRREEARRLASNALDATKRELGEEHAETIGSMNRVVWLLLRFPILNEDDEAYLANLCNEALDKGLRRLGAKHRETLRAMYFKAVLLYDSGDRKAAERLVKHARETSQRVLGPTDPLTIDLGRFVGRFLDDHQQFLDSIATYQTVLENQIRELGRADPETLATMKSLAFALQKLNRFDEQRKLCAEGLETASRIYGVDHPAAVEWKQCLAYASRGLGDWVESYRLQQEVLDWNRQHLGLEHRSTLRAMAQLSFDLSLLGREEESQKLNDELLTIARLVLKPNDEFFLPVLNHRAVGLRRRGKNAEARQAMQEVVDAARRLPQSETIQMTDAVFPPRISLARWLIEDDQIEQAQTLIDETENALPPNDWYYRNVLAWLLVSTPSDEIRDGNRAMKLVTGACELTEYKLATVLDTLAAAHAENGDFASAVVWAEKSVEFASSPSKREEYAQRLESYKNKKPLRAQSD